MLHNETSPAVVTFLREGGALADLGERFAIQATRARRHPNLVLLKYSQIESPFDEPMVRECRGLVLDEDDGWRVVSRSFDKFFNHGERLAAPVDWSSAVVQEKLDGSLCVLYHYAGEWQVQTSGSPDAAGLVGGTGSRFAELFWEVFRQQGYALPGDAERPLCFSFELMTRWNRVVIPHAAPKLTLIGLRHRETGAELPLDRAPRYQAVRTFALDSFTALRDTFLTLPPLQQEGYVVVDAGFQRVKVKHPGYVALHQLKDGMGPRRVMTVIQNGEVGEVLAAFPEWEPEFTQIGAAYAALVAELEDAYERLRDVPGQKEFALEAVKTRFPRALFQLRARRVTSVREALREVPPESLLRALGLRDTGA